jgi:hypothetical protein
MEETTPVAKDSTVDRVPTEAPTEVIETTEIVEETLPTPGGSEAITPPPLTVSETREVIYEEEPPDDGASTGSTLIDYTLRFTGAPSLAQLVAVAVASAVYIVLSWLAIIALPSGFPVVSSVFLAIGFGVPFAIWFGGWAFVIAYLGNFIGAGLLSTPPLPVNIALWFGTTDLIQLGLPMLLYRLLAKRFGVSPIGKDIYTVRGFVFFVLCAVLPNNIIGGLYGNFVLVQTGVIPGNAFLTAWFVWSLSNVVVTLIIGSLLLQFLGPIVERFGLTIRNLLS